MLASSLARLDVGFDSNTRTKPAWIPALSSEDVGLGFTVSVGGFRQVSGRLSLQHVSSKP